MLCRETPPMTEAQMTVDRAVPLAQRYEIVRIKLS